MERGENIGNPFPNGDADVTISEQVHVHTAVLRSRRDVVIYDELYLIPTFDTDLSKELLFMFLQLIIYGISPETGLSNRFSDFGAEATSWRPAVPIRGVIEEIASNFNGIAGSNFQIPLANAGRSTPVLQLR